MRILTVDDNKELTTLLTTALEEAGHEATSCETGEEALARVQEESFDLLLLDVGLPGMDGFQVVRTLRDRGFTAPVVMLTSHKAEEDTVTGLTSGADEYVTKPFSSRVLLARIEAIGRRVSSTAPRRCLGCLELDVLNREVRTEEAKVRLTDREFSLLWTLCDKPIRTWSREALLEEAWKIGFDPETKILDVHLSNLRKKLATLQTLEIELVAGEGYRVQPMEEEGSGPEDSATD